MITREEWRSGDFRNKPEFKTQEGYYNAVSEFVKTYGEPTKEDMFVARNGLYKEFGRKKIGASWNPSIDRARVMAKKYHADTLYVMFVPKGTMAVHFNEGDGKGLSAWEEEYVFDIKGMGLDKASGWGDSKYHLGIIARHQGEWDYAHYLETDKDFVKWKLMTPPWMLQYIHEPIFENFIKVA